MPSRSQVDVLGRGLSEAVRLARRDLERFWIANSSLPGGALRRELSQFFPVLVAEYGNVAATVAGDWYESMTGESAALGAEPNAERASSRMEWAMRNYEDGDRAQALANLGLIADEMVKQFGRDTIIESARTNKRRFARVPAGSHTCAFCLMLASRGFAYHSRAAAGELGKFHPDCDCQIVFQDDTTPEGYDPDVLYEQYASVHESGDDEKAVAAKLRQKYGLK